MLDDRYKGKIIQCHIDRGDPESFVVGNLYYSNNDWFLMQDISPSGHWNGLALYMQSDVVEVKESTDYIQRIKLLIKCRNESKPYTPFVSNDPLISLLGYAKKTNHIIGLELHASGYRDVNGTIGSINACTLCINQVDEFGRADGKSYIAIDSITRCYVDDEESQCLEMLKAQHRGTV